MSACVVPLVTDRFSSYSARVAGSYGNSGRRSADSVGLFCTVAVRVRQKVIITADNHQPSQPQSVCVCV